MKRLLLPAIVAALLSACGSSPMTSEQSPAPFENRSGSPITRGDTNTGIRDGQLPALPRVLSDPNNILSKRSIYFDMDRYDVSPEYKQIVIAHAKFLTENRAFRILIQGNTDERGSREYNLSLGQKRAEGVKQALTLLGVNEDQVEAVSLGEEKPKKEGHDDAAWAENRRADIIYQGEY